jgi:hypothetical protein
MTFASRDKALLAILLRIDAHIVENTAVKREVGALSSALVAAVAAQTSHLR